MTAFSRDGHFPTSKGTVLARGAPFTRARSSGTITSTSRDSSSDDDFRCLVTEYEMRLGSGTDAELLASKVLFGIFLVSLTASQRVSIAFSSTHDCAFDNDPMAVSSESAAEDGLLTTLAGATELTILVFFVVDLIARLALFEFAEGVSPVVPIDLRRFLILDLSFCPCPSNADGEENFPIVPSSLSASIISPSSLLSQ